MGYCSLVPDRPSEFNAGRSALGGSVPGRMPLLAARGTDQPGCIIEDDILENYYAATDNKSRKDAHDRADQQTGVYGTQP